MDELRLVWAGENPRDYSREDISNKGIGLLELFLLKEKDFDVPDFFIVPTSFYRDYARRHALKRKIKVTSIEGINTMLAEQRGYVSQSSAPEQISGLFKDFGEDYKGVLYPAIDKISGIEEYRSFSRKFRRRHADFIRAFHRSMSYARFKKGLAKFEAQDNTLKQDRETLRKLQEQIRILICRSASPLEDGEFPFSGVFRSLAEVSPWDAPGFFSLPFVLSSSYSPYAQFYMEHNQVRNRNREMAVIVQQEIQDSHVETPTFFGDIQVFGKNRAVIRYAPNIRGCSTFYVVIENNEIVRYDGRNKRKLADRKRGREPFGEHPGFVSVPLNKISDRRLVDMCSIARETSSRLNIEACIFEFAIKDGRLYFFQRKPISREIVERYSHANRFLPTIDESKVVTRQVYGHTVGSCVGSFVNLARFGPQAVFGRGTSGLTFNQIMQIDRQYPGAIYLIDPFQFCTRLIESEEEGRAEDSGKKFYMLTPRKKGVIIYNTDATWNHLDSVYDRSRVQVCLIEKDPDNPIHSLKDGERIAICSSGREAVIYKP